MSMANQPQVKLIKSFTTPFDNVVATARTCYSSKGIIYDHQAEEFGREKSVNLAKSIFDAGHHTTFMHAHFQFAISGVSRQFIWSFLHSHKYYNTEQVSQRFVEVKKGSYYVPEGLQGELGELYHSTVEMQFDAYRDLCEILEPTVESEFFKRFNRSDRMAKQHRSTIKKKTQEIARYVLPVATTAYLYHTVNGIVLMRLWAACNGSDVPSETKQVIGMMVDEILKVDPQYASVISDPHIESDFLHNDVSFTGHGSSKEFVREFDSSLGGLSSKLVDWSANSESTVANAVREVLGLPYGSFTNSEMIDLAMNPSRNRILGDKLNLTTMDKIARAMHHCHFTFRKKLSHTADSQNQRHRGTPRTQPLLHRHYYGEPDYITPDIIMQNDKALSLYRKTMEMTWDSINMMREQGVDYEHCLYLLPNAVSVRQTESGDLLDLRHKYEMRLCYNAQEEIWRSSVEEVRQIRDMFPDVGRYLLPPCTMRHLAGIKPTCPEGPRYCGVTVWRKDMSEYERVI